MMSRTRSGIVAVAVIASGLLAGWWLGQSASDTGVDGETVSERIRPTQARSGDERSRIPRLERRSTGIAIGDLEARNAGAIEGERWLSFPDRGAMDRFLSSLDGTGISVLGSLDGLNALRIGFSDTDALAGLLDGTEESGLIYPVTVPDVGSIQDGALGFGSSLLQWMGVDQLAADAGKGIRVAVLDTGMGEHSAFSDQVRQINLIEPPVDGNTLNGHGTAVASLIASEFGLAPGASLLSIRVANDNGTSDSFTLAQGIIDAADNGVDIINISMGSSGNSSILRKAIEYAQESGSLIVASAGNEGSSRVSYPANYEGVVAVGAIDANGNHLDFSNSGDVTLSAPGLYVQSAAPNDTELLFTGTSSSAPIVSGALAHVMQAENIGADQALDLLLRYSNDSGAPGFDAAVGEGYVDLGRILRRDDPNATDAAIASNYVTSGTNGDVVQVTVENRGNTTLINAPVQVSTPTGQVNFNVPTLPAGRSQTFEVPLRTNGLQEGQDFTITSSVSLSSGGSDLNPSNNRKVDVLPAPEAP